MNKIALNLARFRTAVFRHDEINPDHSPAHGIGVSHFDLEKLGFEDGEQLWPGITITVDGGQSGNFRVLCDGEHDDEKAAEAEEATEVTRAVGAEA